jgi:hypothetical protein
LYHHIAKTVGELPKPFIGHLRSGLRIEKSLRADPGLDFKLWQHDIFRENGRPYDPEEIKVIKKLASYADAQEN